MHANGSAMAAAKKGPHRTGQWYHGREKGAHCTPDGPDCCPKLIAPVNPDGRQVPTPTGRKSEPLFACADAEPLRKQCRRHDGAVW